MSFLELKDVSQSYGVGESRTDVLSNLNLSVEEGEFIAIVGFSGSGKTTLISIMCGILWPTEGEVKVFGTDIYGLSDTELVKR